MFYPMGFGEQGANIARIAVLNSDYAENVPGQQINRFCASGLEAVNTAAAQVMSGQSDVAIGGGIESMSRVPMMSDGGAWATDPQFVYKTYFVLQGIGADLIATKYGFSRQDLDAYSVASQQRAAGVGVGWWRQLRGRALSDTRFIAIGFVILIILLIVSPTTPRKCAPGSRRSGAVGIGGGFARRIAVPGASASAGAGAGASSIE